MSTWSKVSVYPTHVVKIWTCDTDHNLYQVNIVAHAPKTRAHFQVFYRRPDTGEAYFKSARYNLIEPTAEALTLEYLKPFKDAAFMQLEEHWDLHQPLEFPKTAILGTDAQGCINTWVLHQTEPGGGLLIVEGSQKKHLTREHAEDTIMALIRQHLKGMSP